MSIKLDSGFEIIRFSDSAYEQITVEVQYRGEQIVQINKDKGINLFEIEIFTEYTDSDFLPKFLLKDFIFALNKAQELLKNS